MRPETRALRVLHVTSVETDNYYLDNLARFTPRGEVELLAATLGNAGSFVAGLEALGVRCWALGARRRRSYPRAAFRLWRIVRRERIDILHLHLFEPTVVGLLVARLARRPVVVTRHHSDAIHTLPPGIKHRALSALESWINASASHVIAPSERVREVLTGIEGLAAAKVSVIPYGQLQERFEAVRSTDPQTPRAALGLGSPSIVCVCRLHPEKGHRFLLPAYARLTAQWPRATLCLVGVGPAREALVAQARALGVGESVRFAGWRDDALQLLWSADLVVHPSLHEALPSAVIEAVMLGRPVVATDVSGVRDVLGGRGEYGAIVPPGDEEALYRAMAETLRALEPARARAEAGRRHVADYMDAARVAEQYVRCYQAIAGARA